MASIGGLGQHLQNRDRFCLTLSYRTGTRVCPVRFLALCSVDGRLPLSLHFIFTLQLVSFRVCTSETVLKTLSSRDLATISLQPQHYCWCTHFPPGNHIALGGRNGGHFGSVLDLVGCCDCRASTLIGLHAQDATPPSDNIHPHLVAPHSFGGKA